MVVGQFELFNALLFSTELSPKMKKLMDTLEEQMAEIEELEIVFK